VAPKTKRIRKTRAASATRPGHTKIAGKTAKLKKREERQKTP
jgi:hypothetical protein